MYECARISQQKQLILVSLIKSDKSSITYVRRKLIEEGFQNRIINISKSRLVILTGLL